jgi:hypothetical protein
LRFFEAGPHSETTPQHPPSQNPGSLFLHSSRTCTFILSFSTYSLPFRRGLHDSIIFRLFDQSSFYLLRSLESGLHLIFVCFYAAVCWLGFLVHEKLAN